MKLLDILSKNCISDNLKSKNKKDVLIEMVGIMKSLNKIEDSDNAVERLMKREALGSTGIGYGVAIPHAKIDKGDNLVAFLGRSEMGVDFDSLDGLPVKLFFLLLTPKNSEGVHLKALARISLLFKEKLFRQELLYANDSDGLYQIIEREDNSKS